MTNPSDLVTPIKLPDGRSIEVIQPGGRIVRSKNWRLNENAYRSYESHIREAIKAWPQETCFNVPNGMSPNTFEHRLRDAMQAIKLYGYDADVQSALGSIRDELVVSMDPDGSKVWIRARGTRGRPIQMHRQENVRPQLAVESEIKPTPTEEVVQAYAVLLTSPAGFSPIQFKGRLSPELINKITSEYDVAFAYDDATNVTRML